MNPPFNQTNEALINVRKAFRLLHDFQRSALDAIGYVGRELGLDYYDWGSCFSESDPKDLGCWAWDWLPMMFCDVTFISGKDITNPPRMTVWLFSDTGYFDSADPCPEATNIQTFAPAEISRTVLGFFFYRAWKEEYDSFPNDSVGLREFLDSGRLPGNFTADGVVGMCADFYRLTDLESADELVAELAVLAKSGGFEIERVRKAK
jgi:hypothetical protein